MTRRSVFTATRPQKMKVVISLIIGGTWVNSMGEPVYFSSGNDATWWVVEGDKKYLASQLFSEVARFWQSFLDRYTIR
jgi:hypothetical protein